MPRGYSSFADVMRTTADGRDLNDLFSEFQSVADLANQQQQNFLSLLTFPTNSPVVSVLQTLGAGAIFEPASEYGRPVASRIEPNTLDMGANFTWFDAAWRSTWQYVASATAVEIEAQTQSVLTADSDNVFNKVMGTLFRSTNRSVTDPRTGVVYNVYCFANGDGWVPPSYAGNSFPGTHTHYRTSGAATVDSGDLDEVIADFKSHGYSSENGSQIVIFVNPAQGDVINGFRVAASAKADFIPAQGARFYSPNQLVGEQPAASFAGFPVKGAYDEALIIESTRIPAGYLAALASGGSLVSSNPIMYREHPRLRGLQLVPGPSNAYPLLDSTWVRGFGTGVRHRLAGLVMQITTSASYTAPAL